MADKRVRAARALFPSPTLEQGQLLLACERVGAQRERQHQRRRHLGRIRRVAYDLGQRHQHSSGVFDVRALGASDRRDDRRGGLRRRRRGSVAT